MKLVKKLLGLSLLSLAGVSMVAGLATASPAKADGTYSYKIGGQTYELEDELVNYDMSGNGKMASQWGNQPATVQYVDGEYVVQANQTATSLGEMGSYHTVFDLKFTGEEQGNFTMMLRQNSGELSTTNGGEGQAYLGARTGYELIASNHYAQFFYNTEGGRTALHPGGFLYDEDNHLQSGDVTYKFELYVMNLADETVQIIINVNGENKLNYNSSADAGVTPVKRGTMYIGNHFSDAAGTRSFSIKGYPITSGQYSLEDSLTEVDLSPEGALTSRWGRQAATVQFVNGEHVCEAYQPINAPLTTGSYHTKFDIKFRTVNANWFNMMLRQSSGTFAHVDADNVDIDIGARNGFELFTGDNGFQLYYNENNTRSDMLKWFAYDETGCWGVENRSYTFEIWVLNLLDGSIQINVDVNGTNVCTYNTSESTCLQGKELVKEGQMRWAGEFDPQNLSSMAWTLKGYGAFVWEKPCYEIEDALTEWDISAGDQLASRWGNQPNVCEFVDGKYVITGGQPINGLTQMGSYHTKFDLNYHNDGGAAFHFLLRKNSGTELVMSNGGEGLIDIGARTGYEIFTGDNGFQFFYNNGEDTARVNLTPGWFAYDSVNNFQNPDKTYTFEIWMLNLVNGTVQIIIDVNGENILTYNSSADPAVTPLKTGSFTLGGTFTDTLSHGCDIKGHKLETEVEIEGELPTTVKALEEVDLTGVVSTSSFEKFDVKGGVSATVNSRVLGETTMTLSDGSTAPIEVVADSEATYSIKDGCTKEYLVNDAFVNDLVLVKTVGEASKEFAVLDSEITGFDSATNGEKELSVSVAGQTLKVPYKVSEYRIAQSSKAEFLKDSVYTDGDVVLEKVCGDHVETTLISADDLESFETEELGETTLTFTKFGKEFTHTVKVVDYSLKEGCKTEYKVGEEFAGDIVVIKNDGTTEQEIAITLDQITGFDVTTEGKKTLTFSLAGIEYEILINVLPAPKKGCGGSIVASSILVSLFSVAGIVLLKKKED